MRNMTIAEAEATLLELRNDAGIDVAKGEVMLIKPGDTLVLTLGHPPRGGAEIEEIRRCLKEHFPDIKVMVLSPGSSLSILRKDEQ